MIPILRSGGNKGMIPLDLYSMNKIIDLKISLKKRIAIINKFTVICMLYSSVEFRFINK